MSDDDDLYQNSAGEEVEYDDLSDAEQAFYNSDTAHESSDVDEYAANWDSDNADDWPNDSGEDD